LNFAVGWQGCILASHPNALVAIAYAAAGSLLVRVGNIWLIDGVFVRRVCQPLRGAHRRSQTDLFKDLCKIRSNLTAACRNLTLNHPKICTLNINAPKWQTQRT
jgi:hypothetical protein